MRTYKVRSVVKALVLFILAIFHLALLFAAAEEGYDILHHLFLGKSAYTHEAAYQIPGTSEEIVMERRPIHLYLAEYEKAIIFRSNNNDMVRKFAAIDTGGYSKMKLYKVSPSNYLLCGDLSQDRWLLDVENISIREIGLDETVFNLVYLGMFATNENRRWDFIANRKLPEYKEELITNVCGSA